MKDYKEESKNSFNKQAKIYDKSNYSKYPRECYPYVLQELSQIKFSNMLDLGCGTGTVLSLLLENKPNIKAYGLDLSREMLNIARQKLQDKVKFIEGDSEYLPYGDNCFDVVMCTESFHHYPNPLKVLKEVYRVLKPKGKLVLCDTWVLSPVRQIMNVFIKLSNTGDVKIYSEKEITNMFKKVGFKEVHWKKITRYAYICNGVKED